MLEYALGFTLILVPLCMRIVTADAMRKRTQYMQQIDGEFRAISDEMNDVQTQLQEAERQQRQYAIRRSRLLNEIDAARGELERLRRPAGVRMAA